MENGRMEVPISSIVKQLRKIDFFQPLYEAITNSLEANAENIEISFLSSSAMEKEFYTIKGYKIIDDGDGFTSENISSFGTYLSDYKAKLGCKGVGRFVWLAIFSNVSIVSFIDNKKIEIDFNTNFGPHRITDFNISEKKTIISMEKARPDISFPIKRIDDIKKGILDHFLILLHLRKKPFRIIIKLGKEQEIIHNSTLPRLDRKDFKIGDYCFFFYYDINTEASFKEVDIYYCANGRIVKKAENIFDKSILKNKNIHFVGFFESEYLNACVNDERTGFTFAKYNLDQNKIEDEFIDIFNGVLYKYFPDLERQNDEVIKQCKKDYPHLSDWINEDKSPVKQRERIIKTAKEKFDKAKEKIREKFNRLISESIPNTVKIEEEIDNVSHIQALQLSEYVLYRQQIIDALKVLETRNEPVEKLLHNLFMKMGTSAGAKDGKIDPYKSNIWLLDDKFMSYSYMASDKNIRTIFKENKLDNVNYFKEPDVFVFYSREGREKDAIIIEFKAPGAKNDEKAKSISELPDNIGQARSAAAAVNDIINQIWGYIITNIDDRFEISLKNNDFKPQFTSESNYKIFHKYFVNLDSHIYVLDAKVIIADADSRNSVFMNILRENHTER